MMAVKKKRQIIVIIRERKKIQKVQTTWKSESTELQIFRRSDTFYILFYANIVIEPVGKPKL